MSATLYICLTCKGTEPLPDSFDPSAPRLGALLHAAVTATPAPDGVQVVGVECLSACSQGASVALQAGGKWTYVYGRLTPDDAPDILTGAALYAASADGIVPWRDRPAIFRKQSLARIPPLPAALEV